MHFEKSVNWGADPGFEEIISDIISDPEYQKLKGFCHHNGISRFDHCVRVARLCWYAARLFRLRVVDTVRGAMLHDFYLYRNDLYAPSTHIRTHPQDSLDTASKRFALSDIEADIILCHMWPMTKKRPAYPESYIVNIADTLCAIFEYISSAGQRSRNEELRRSCPSRPQTPCEPEL